MTSRPHWQKNLMDQALVAARMSTCSRLSVGAVLAQGRHVISTGYNGAPSGLPHCTHDPGSKEPCTISVHAEANAIVQAARHGMRTDGSALYLTHAPCLACSGLLLNAGVQEVYFRMFYRSNAGIERLRLAGLKVEPLVNFDNPGPRGSELMIRRCRACQHPVATHDSGRCMCGCLQPVGG